MNSYFNPFKTVIVTGVPGVGKTTVLEKLKEKAKEENIELLVVNFGDYMLKAAMEKGVVNDRDKLRTLDHRTQLRLQKEAASLIIKDARDKLGENGVLIVDTHSIVKTSSGYWPGLPEHVVKELRPDSIVLIEAKPEDIIRRQKKDETRYRKDIADPKVLSEMMTMARIAAVASATLTASSVYTVENPEGDLDYPVKKILDLFNLL
jgi:adenylate kinase